MTSFAPQVLVILDGFGYQKKTQYNAILQAKTPHLDNWLQTYPHTILHAAGSAVGLLPNYIGNSEVGHLTIGSGRIIKQPVSVIHEAIDNGTCFKKKILLDAFEQVKQKHGRLHIFGLLSDAGVHAHEKHIHAYIKAAVNNGITNIFVHPFLDGRDTPPKSAEQYLQRLDNTLAAIGHGTIGSVHGRFYAMDRDGNWERIEQSYRVLTKEHKVQFKNWSEVLSHYYTKNITDEFIPPTQLDASSIIKNGDGIIFCNFRPDRARQLTAAFTESDFTHFPRKSIQLACFVTPTKYNTLLKTEVLYSSPEILNAIKEVLAQHNKTIFTAAETEKYAHVTYFFNGGREEAVATEKQVLIPSLPAKNYIDHPAMSAQKITYAIIKSLQTDPKDFYLINYANADMVAHSGNFEATIKAVEILDEQLGQLFEQVITNMNGTFYITADHGNAEDMFDEETGQPRTAHTNNPVPFIMIQQGLKQSDMALPLNQLSDIAPFILQNMNLLVPEEME